MPGTRHRLGVRGERVAARHLRLLGYTIVQKNYRALRGEIDLVALDGETLVFVEVKTRAAGGMADPVEVVAADKRRHLLRAAAAFVRQFGLEEREIRFDVVAVRALGWARWEIEVVRDAFEAPAGLWI